MADLSNVPPEVMQILTHDPPYSEGEKAILQNYASQPDANPVMVRALQNLGVTESPYTPPPPQSRDLGIPGLDIPDSIGGIGLPTADFLGGGPGTPPPPSPYETSAFHEDLKHQGSADINFDRMRAEPAATPPGNIPGFGAPTLDFLSPLSGAKDYLEPEFPNGGGSKTPSTRGDSPYLSNTQLGQRTPGGADPLSDMFAAQTGTPAGSNTQTQGVGTDWKAERGAIDIPYDPLMINPASAFAGVADSQITRVANNPEFMADVLYPGAPNFQANQTEWLSNVKMLSELGLLSGVPNADIFAGRPESDITMLEQVEALKNSMAGKGSQVDPRAIYREAFTRILNSDASQFKAEGYGSGVAGDAENQIAVTNGMLGAVAPFVYSGSREAYIQRLNQAGMQYLSEVAMSGTSLSYPEWLKAHGADTWMS